MLFRNYVKREEPPQVVPVTAANESAVPPAPCVPERILSSYRERQGSKWHLYLFMKGGRANAAIYFILSSDKKEVLGIDYADNVFLPEAFRGLMAKALNFSRRPGFGRPSTGRIATKRKRS